MGPPQPQPPQMPSFEVKAAAAAGAGEQVPSRPTKRPVRLHPAKGRRCRMPRQIQRLRMGSSSTTTKTVLFSSIRTISPFAIFVEYLPIQDLIVVNSGNSVQTTTNVNSTLKKASCCQNQLASKAPHVVEEGGHAEEAAAAAVAPPRLPHRLLAHSQPPHSQLSPTHLKLPAKWEHGLISSQCTSTRGPRPGIARNNRGSFPQSRGPQQPQSQRIHRQCQHSSPEPLLPRHLPWRNRKIRRSRAHIAIRKSQISQPSTNTQTASTQDGLLAWPWAPIHINDGQAKHAWPRIPLHGPSHATRDHYATNKHAWFSTQGLQGQLLLFRNSANSGSRPSPP